MSLRKPNLHYVTHEISQSERRLHYRNLFLVANEKWCTVELYQSHISSDRVRSGYEISLKLQPVEASLIFIGFRDLRNSSKQLILVNY